jgi:phosphopantothenoylcysteine decarboxylase/phosphopantothenate--cysteine ligase
MTIKLLEDKQIVLGVTGSIASYKAVDLASRLTQAGAAVEVILTEAAGQFVSPVTFRSVTGRPVHGDMWDLDEHIGHVRLGEAADLLVIAPATAHTIAKMAHGLADNLLMVTVLAARRPVLVAPAMDGGMYEHQATQANIALLKSRDVTFVGPAVGRMASGLVGPGRLLEPPELVGHIRLVLGRDGSLAGRKVVVTAGPTREPLDPVRFLSNRSSGRQGLALAQAALDAGASVTLIAGPIEAEVPVGVELVPVTTAVEMHDAVISATTGSDALLMSAAVSDFRPTSAAEHKIKKKSDADEGLTIHLDRNPDILEAVNKLKSRTGFPKITIGFAAETQNALEHGRGKLQRKGLDLIVINDVSAADAGFAVETNRVTILGAADQVDNWPLLDKSTVAERLIGLAAQLLADQRD